MTWGAGITIAFCLGNAFAGCLFLLFAEVEGLVRARRAGLAAAEAEELRRPREIGPDHWKQDTGVTSPDSEVTSVEGGEVR